MKALSVKQPWAWAMFADLPKPKNVENRDWPTRLRGRIAIHTSKNVTRNEIESAWDFMRHCDLLSAIPEASELVHGAVIGTIELYDCVSDSENPWFMGDYGFLLRNPIKLVTPIPCIGKLNFWELPKEISKTIEQLEQPQTAFTELHATLTDDEQYALDERAAIYEHDGGLSRAKAEAMAAANWACNAEQTTN